DLVQTTGAVVGIGRGPAVGMDRLMESVQAVVRLVYELSAPIDDLNLIPGEVVHIALGICQWIRTSTKAIHRIVRIRCLAISRVSDTGQVAISVIVEPSDRAARIGDTLRLVQRVVLASFHSTEGVDKKRRRPHPVTTHPPWN